MATPLVSPQGASDGERSTPAIIHAWRLEWRRALRRRRLFLLNVIVPLGLVTPVVAGAAPPQHAAVVYVVLFVFFGTFGSAIPLLRDAERGMVRRLTLLPAEPGPLLAGRVLAGAAIDVLQLSPAVVLIVLTGTRGPDVPWLLLVLPATLVFAGVLGTWIAAIARSVAEGALFAAVSALLLLHASGVFRTPMPGTVADAFEKTAPFRAVHEILLGAPLAGVGALLGAVGVSVLVTLMLGRNLMRSLARSDDRH
jgi:ABC-2 type transport system permease protein